MNPPPRHRTLSRALSRVLPATVLGSGLLVFMNLPAQAARHEASDDTTTNLDTVQVTASPLQGTAESLARPVDILYGQALDQQKSTTLGDTVSKLPGVQTSNFGPGVGRPIIRGQDGPRVQVLSNGIGTMDASTVSADHATTVETFLADQIEVLKGPATLLFGSGAIGGAVNVADGRIASELPGKPLSGRAELRGNTVNDERSGMFRLDGVNGNWVLHVDGLVRNTGDYDIPGHALAIDDHDHAANPDNPKGTLQNSSIRTRAGAVGATWLGDRGHFGLSLNTYRSNYGIPNGAHEHSADDDHAHGDSGEDEGNVRIDLTQNRLDLKTGINQPLPFLESLNLNAAYNDYEHVEIENGTPATHFTNKGYEGRLEAVQKQMNGWRGAFGLQFGHSDFAAIGEEAFVPATLTDNLGLFVLQEKDFGPLKLELGGRYERVALDPEPGYENKRFNTTSLSTAAIWRINDTFDLRLGLDSSERAPTNEELFAAGAHVATRSLEIGSTSLDTERSRRAEIGLHAHTNRVDFRAALYQSNFRDFIYLADTGIEEQNLPVRLWTQSDAVFKGMEAEAKVRLADAPSGLWELRVFGDYVRAELDGGGTRTVDFDVPHGDHSHGYEVELAQTGYLPRIAPARMGANLDWSLAGWRASLGAVRYSRQNHVAQNEAPSPGYTLVDAHLGYRWDLPNDKSWEVFLDGSNLGNQEIRPHTSLLRDYAPLPGRAVAFGIRAFF